MENFENDRRPIVNIDSRCFSDVANLCRRKFVIENDAVESGDAFTSSLSSSSFPGPTSESRSKRRHFLSERPRDFPPKRVDESFKFLKRSIVFVGVCFLKLYIDENGCRHEFVLGRRGHV